MLWFVPFIFGQAVEWAGGSLDILVNNAGICVLEDFMDISSDSFDEVIAINTRAPLLVSQVLFLQSKVQQCVCILQQ